MKQFIFSSLFLFFITTSLCGQSKDEKKVAAAVEKMRKAMVEANKTDLESISSESLSYGHSSGTIEDKTQFVGSIVSGKSDFVSITLKDQTIKINGNSAVVRHILTADTNDGGKPGKVNIGILLVWQKEKGQWKLLARQAYKI